MPSDIDQIIGDALEAALTTTPVWHEERAQGTASSYVVYATETVRRGAGSAPLLDLLVEVRCVAPTSDGASVLAASARSALDGYSGVLNGARVLDLTAVEMDRESPGEEKLWGVVLRLRGLAIE